MLKILQADGGQLPLDFDKYFIQEEMNGEDQIGFTLPLDHADYKQLAEEVQLLDAEDGQVYRITAIDEGAVTANIKGKLELSSLRADMRIPYTNGSDTLAGTVEGVLPAGWTVVDHSLSTIRRTIELDSATPEDVILGAASVFGGLAIRYKIADKSVHFYDPGDFKAGGVYLTEELNLTSTNFKGSSSGLCTRLYARGKDGLTFAGINGGKDYVENFSYTDKIICAYWEDERYTVAENLLEAAQKKVDASAVPVRSYSCGVVDLAKAWRYEEGAGSNIYAHLNIQLLTVATLLDTRRGTRIDHQVVQYKRYPHYPDLNVVTLSTKAPTITATVKQLQDAIENPSSSFRKQMQNLINQMAAGISGHDGGTMEITFNSEGKKMGKTASGAVWLDPNKTSPYDFYQYWRNVGDADVLKCIRMLTFLPLKQIDEMDKWEGSQLNRAKEILAYELTALVHGEEEAKKAENAAKALFGAGGDSANMPTTVLADADFENGGINILSLLVATGLCPSRGEARRLVQQGGIVVDEKKVESIDESIPQEKLAGDGVIIRKGKKVFHKAVTK